MPADQFPAGIIQDVVPVGGRAHSPAPRAILDHCELMAEDELDAADARRAEPKGILRQRQGFHVAGLLSSRDEQFRVRDARQGALQWLQERLARFLRAPTGQRGGA